MGFQWWFGHFGASRLQCILRFRNQFQSRSHHWSPSLFAYQMPLLATPISSCLRSPWRTPIATFQRKPIRGCLYILVLGANWISLTRKPRTCFAPEECVVWWNYGVGCLATELISEYLNMSTQHQNGKTLFVEFPTGGYPWFITPNKHSKLTDTPEPLKTCDLFNFDMPVAYREIHSVNGHLCLYRWLCWLKRLTQEKLRLLQQLLVIRVFNSCLRNGQGWSQVIFDQHR